MKKEILRGSIVLAVLLLIYNLIIFVVPFIRTADFWIVYTFTLLAFIIAAASIYIAFIKKSDAKSRFYGFPIAKLGVVYLLAQIIVGLVFLLLGKFIPFWVTLIVCAMGFAAAIIGLISAEAVVDEIHIQDDSLKSKVALMRSLQSKVSRMAAQCDDTDALKAIRAFAEDLRYSDPVSNESLHDIETALSASIDNLQTAVLNGNWTTVIQLSRKASDVLAERNRLCKLNKH